MYVDVSVVLSILLFFVNVNHEFHYFTTISWTKIWFQTIITPTVRRKSTSKWKSLNVLLFIDLVPIKSSKCHFGEPRPNELIWIIDCQLILCKFFLHWKKTQLIRMNDLHVVWFRVFECTQHQLHIDWFN